MRRTEMNNYEFLLVFVLLWNMTEIPIVEL